MANTMDFSQIETTMPTIIMKRFCIENQLDVHEIDGFENYDACQRYFHERFFIKDGDNWVPKKGWERSDWLIAGRCLYMLWWLLYISSWNVLIALAWTDEQREEVEKRVKAESKLYYTQWKQEEERMKERNTIPEQFQIYLEGGGDKFKIDLEGTDIKNFLPPLEGKEVNYDDLMAGNIIIEEDEESILVVKRFVHEESVADIRENVLKKIKGMKNDEFALDDLSSSKDEKLNDFIGVLFLAQQGQIGISQKEFMKSPIIIKKTKQLNGK